MVINNANLQRFSQFSPIFLPKKIVKEKKRMNKHIEVIGVDHGWSAMKKVS